jgi:hypothetical protein
MSQKLLLFEKKEELNTSTVDGRKRERPRRVGGGGWRRKCNDILVYRNASLRILVSYDFNTQHQCMFEKAGAWRVLQPGGSCLPFSPQRNPVSRHVKRRVYDRSSSADDISLVLPSISRFSSWPMFSCSTVLPTRHSWLSWPSSCLHLYWLFSHSSCAVPSAAFLPRSSVRSQIVVFPSNSSEHGCSSDLTK